MIKSFGHKLAEHLFTAVSSKEIRNFPMELRRGAKRKLLMLAAAGELQDLKVPPGNRLESLKGRWGGFYSIRINDRWRVMFQWEMGHAFDVKIVDYH